MYLVSDSDTAAVSDAEKREEAAEVRRPAVLLVVAVSAGCSVRRGWRLTLELGPDSTVCTLVRPGRPCQGWCSTAGTATAGELRHEVTPTGVHPCWTPFLNLVICYLK